MKRPHTVSSVIRIELLVAVSSLSMFLMGFSDALKGSVVGEMVSTAGLDYSFGGLIIGTSYFGFFAGTLATFFLLPVIRVALLLEISLGVIGLGALSFGISSSTFQILFSAFLVGLGCGLVDVTANLAVKVADTHGKVGKALVRLAFYHGVGAIVAPLFALAIITYFHHWQAVYRVAFFVLLAAVILSIFGIQKSGCFDKRIGSRGSTFMFNKKLVLLAFLLFWYMTIEAGLSGWIVTYALFVSPEKHSLAHGLLSAFFILLTCGRLVSSNYVDSLGLEKSIILGGAGALISLTISLVFPSLNVLLPLVGLFLSFLFPTTVALISNELGDAGLHTMGIFFSISGIGGLVGPYFVGLLASAVSLTAGMWLLVAFGICFLLFIVRYARLRGR